MNIFNRAVLPSTLFLMMTHSYAEDAFDPKGQYFFGDWDGKRTELAKKGIKFESHLRADTAYLADGGRNPGADPEIASQLWLGSTVDMEKFAGWDGVTINIAITARQGQSIGPRNLQDPSAPVLGNVQGGFGRGNEQSRLSTLTIEKNFKDLGLSIKAGRMAMGADFDFMPCDFQNMSFCAAQMGKWQNSIWKNLPAAQWGARVKYNLSPEWVTSLGVYEFNPDDGNAKAEGQGWSMDSDNADGVTVPFEIMWQPKSFVNGLAGTYRFGAMYNTANDPANQFDITNKKIGLDRSYGGWVAIEQQLTSTGSGKQGLHGFANFTWHDRMTTKVDNSQQFGFKYYGLVASKPNDFIGFGFDRIHLNSRFVDSKKAAGNYTFDGSAEYDIELNYNYFPTKWLLLRPNIQYVINPGVTNKVDNALVLGLSTKLTF